MKNVMKNLIFSGILALIAFITVIIATPSEAAAQVQLYGSGCSSYYGNCSSGYYPAPGIVQPATYYGGNYGYNYGNGYGNSYGYGNNYGNSYGNSYYQQPVYQQPVYQQPAYYSNYSSYSNYYRAPTISPIVYNQPFYQSIAPVYYPPAPVRWHY
ncbi:MAG: hypothetical protein NT077_02000 [Candidatus Taylorbacteria bacterium]|nr:hypothetical protein [Candidatus Taylorbacteria bacterium]